MGYIKEPYGIDLQIYPSHWTNEDFAYISMVIAHYKKTGKILKTEPSKQVRKKKSVPKTIVTTPLPIQEVPNA